MTRAARAESAWWGDILLVGTSAIALAVVLVLVFSNQEVSARVAVHDLGQEVGEVIARTNEVRRRGHRSLVWNDLESSARVYQNDAVFVGPDSAATIRLADGSRVDIDEASLVVIGQEQRDAAHPAVIAVDILRGGVSGSASQRLDLRGGGASTRLRQGTTVAMRVRRDRTTRVMVKRGEASVATTAGATTVREGERQTLDASGRAKVSRAAIQLHSPEDGARVYLNPTTGAHHFGWAETEGRGAYRFQLALDPGFARLAVDSRTKRPTASVSTLAAGVYHWRVVRGTSTSEERTLILVDDWPPVPYRPRAGSVVDLSQTPSLSLAWGTVPNVTHYRVELARGHSFQTPLYSLRTDRPSHILRSDEVKIEEGRHCLRVRADEPERDNSPWSRVVCFRIVVRPVLRAPEVYDPTREAADASEDTRR